MHPGAFEFIGRHGTHDAISVIEIGSRDINGSARAHFPGAKWIGLDLYPGPGVDVVADAINYTPAESVDLVVIAEVLEHCYYWPHLLYAAERWLKPAGKVIVTCAGPGRDPHSAIDGGELLHPDEHYANVTQVELQIELHEAGFERIEVSGNEYWKDTYAVAWKL